MSRLSEWWPERRQVRLEPGVAELDSAEPWRGAVERLQAVPWPKRADLSVVLSNHFVRYAVIPQHDGAATADEELALARHQFARLHGERAKAWEVRLSPQDGGAQLACAIDAALLSELRGVFSKQKKARLVSVQPCLVSAFNRARRRIPREGAWLVVAEPQRVCLARLAARGWACVHNTRETDWERLLERERSRSSGERLPSLVLKEQFS